MQKDVELDLICLIHGEKIISCQVTGNNINYCLKCLMQKKALKLMELRTQKIHNLLESKGLSENRLQSLKTFFLTIKEKFDQEMDKILNTISVEITSIDLKIKLNTEKLSQNIEDMNLTSITNEITEVKNQLNMEDDLLINQDDKLRNQMICQYLELVKSLNQQFKQISQWKQHHKKRINKKNEKNEKPQQIQGQLPKYYRFQQEKEIYHCLAMTLSEDEKTLVNGKSEFIQIWNFNIDGSLIFKQNLKSHSDVITNFCLSRTGKWFISGSKDKTLRIWQRDEKDQWICSQILKEIHQDWILGIELNNEEDQFYSCSWDGTIIVWRRLKNQIKWECDQILITHSFQAYFLTLSPNSKSLALSGADRLIIWQQDGDSVLQQRQVINKLIDDNYLRIKFIDNDQLIASTEKQGKLYLFSLNNEGLFKVFSQLNLHNIKEVDVYCFPIIYNKQLGLAIIRHGRDYTYILKRQVNGEFIIQEVLNVDYRAGYLANDGKYLILYNFNNRSIDVMKQFNLFS